MTTRKKAPPPVTPDLLTIEFEDVEGRVVALKSPATLAEYFAIREAYGEANWGDRDTFLKMYAAFGSKLVSWTFDAPATAEGMANINPQVGVAIVGAWLNEVRDAPRPLPRRSSSGELSPVQ